VRRHVDDGDEDDEHGMQDDRVHVVGQKRGLEAVRKRV
jgi:hypothetical protein